MATARVPGGACSIGALGLSVIASHGPSLLLAVWNDARSSRDLPRGPPTYDPRLWSFARIVVFDRRELGLSDRVTLTNMPTLERRMDDIRAVLDDLGIPRAAVLGQGYGSPIALLFAATYPERTSSLVLYSPSAK